MSNPFRHVLVAVDFGASSMHALDLAMNLVEGTPATLTVVHAWSVPPLAYAGLGVTGDVINALESAAKLDLEEAMKLVRARIPGAHGLLRQGLPLDEVLAVIAQHEIDLVVVGTHGRQGVSRFFLGSIAEKIARLSPVPVLVAHGS